MRLRSGKTVAYRFYSQKSFIDQNVHDLKEISSPHWRSEALVPQFNPRTRGVTAFHHAKNPKEQSPLGTKFLQKNSTLKDAADSTLGILQVHETVRSRGISSGTAFQVGPGGIIL